MGLGHLFPLERIRGRIVKRSVNSQTAETLSKIKKGITIKISSWEKPEN